MGTICKIGEIQKHPNRKWYRKDAESGTTCEGCSYATNGKQERCPSSDGRSMIDQTRTPVADGGCDCEGAIWVKVPAPPALKKHVWATRTLEITDRVPKTTLRALILEGLGEINELGTENAKLKNQIASLKKKGTK